MDSFYFPLYECETLTPSFSQDSAVLNCRSTAPPIGTSCAWNAELSSRLGVPLYKCTTVVNGVTLPLLTQEREACTLTVDNSGEITRFACPRGA